MNINNEYANLAKIDIIELKDFKDALASVKNGHDILIKCGFDDKDDVMEYIIECQETNEFYLAELNKCLIMMTDGHLTDCKGLRNAIKACKLKMKYVSESIEICQKSMNFIMSNKQTIH